MKSKFAQQVAKDRAAQLERRKDGAGGAANEKAGAGTNATKGINSSDEESGTRNDSTARSAES